MIHDQNLVDQLSALTGERFDGEVFRATGVGANPLAFSLNGGRWAPAAVDGTEVPALYTSMERDGALAEVVSYLTLLTPLPSKPLSDLAPFSHPGVRADSLRVNKPHSWS